MHTFANFACVTVIRPSYVSIRGSGPTSPNLTSSQKRAAYGNIISAYNTQYNVKHEKQNILLAYSGVLLKGNSAPRTEIAAVLNGDRENRGTKRIYDVARQWSRSQNR